MPTGTPAIITPVTPDKTNPGKWKFVRGLSSGCPENTPVLLAVSRPRGVTRARNSKQPRGASLH